MNNDDYFREKEAKALAIGNDRKLLLKRLEETKSLLSPGLSRSFGKGVFDFDAKTLTGDNGVVLEWRVRSHPSEPESYENQQTTVGVVYAYQKPTPKLSDILKGDNP